MTEAEKAKAFDKIKLVLEKIKTEKGAARKSWVDYLMGFIEGILS